MNRIAGISVKKQNYHHATALLKKIISLQPEKADAYYNLACIYAIQNRITDSTTYLKSAMEHGYNNMNQIRTDKDLENIRKTEYYRNLINGKQTSGT